MRWVGGAGLGLEAARAEIAGFWRANRVPILVAFGAALLLYSSLVTQFVFTDHTLPNIGLYGYPSFKTLQEGRWFADMLIWLGGGAGTQSFQSVAAFFLQAVNGALFATLLRVRGTPCRTIIALLVALHPAALDYYAFTADGITFTFGDTLILLGVLALDRRGRSWVALTAATLAFVLAFAAYQPKIAVLATVVLAWLATRALARDTGAAELLRLALAAALCCLAALGLYWLSIQITMVDAAGRRPDATHVNDWGEVVRQFVNAYRVMPASAWRQIQHLPSGTGFAAALLVPAGLAAVLVRGWRRGALAFLAAGLALALLPPAIHLSAIVNRESWPDAGRLSMGYAYALPFLAGAAMVGLWPRRIVAGLAAIVLYGFAIIAVQENQFISTKTLFETSLMSRIVGRIEMVLPDRAIRPLVVAGSTKFGYARRLVQEFDRPLRPQFRVPAFIAYRQVQIANFFLGEDLLRAPSEAERAAALAGVEHRPQWPAAGSVYLQDGAVVVNLGQAEASES